MHNRLKQVREVLRDENGKKYSQTKFAECMKVTRDMIATYESGRVEPSALFISSLCEKFDVNEIWLRTGEGEMHAPKSREEEIAELANSLIEDDNKYKAEFIKAVSKLSERQLSSLSDYAEFLLMKSEKEKNSPEAES